MTAWIRPVSTSVVAGSAAVTVQQDIAAVLRPGMALYAPWPGGALYIIESAAAADGAAELTLDRPYEGATDAAAAVAIAPIFGTDAAASVAVAPMISAFVAALGSIYQTGGDSRTIRLEKTAAGALAGLTLACGAVSWRVGLDGDMRLRLLRSTDGEATWTQLITVDAETGTISSPLALITDALDQLATDLAGWRTTAEAAATSATSAATSAGVSAMQAATSAAGAAAEIEARGIGISRTKDGFAIRDADGNIAFLWDRNGIKEKNYNTLVSSVQALSEIGNTVVIRAGRRVNFRDADGNIALTFGGPEGLQEKSYLAEKRKIAALRRGAGLPLMLAEVAHIATVGQSLSIGTLATPAVSTVGPGSWAQMFAGGLRTRDAVPTIGSSFYNPDFYNGFADLHEAAESVYGETVSTECARMISQLLAEEDALDIATLGQKLLYTCPGEGGMSLAQLSPGGTSDSGEPLFARVGSDMTQALSLSHTAGRSYAPALLQWMQMERDFALATDPATYVAGLETYRQAYIAQCAAVCGYTPAMPLHSYQANSFRNYSRDGALASAVADYCSSHDSYALVAPLYPWVHAGAGDVHLTAASTRTLAGYFGIAAKRRIFDGVKPRWLRPVSAAFVGSDTVVVQFDVPVGRLVVDAVRVSDPGSWGFALATAAGADIAISDVRLVGHDRVVVRGAAAIETGGAVRYAWGTAAMTQSGPTLGPRGCIRDQQGDFLTAHGVAMHNWAPTFQFKRS